MSDYSLKPGWKTYRFDQIAISVTDRVEPDEAEVEHYVGLTHLDSDSLKIRRWGVPSDVTGTKFLFRKGDIIFGRRRVYQRKLAVAEFDGICSAHAMVLRPKTDVVLPEFLPFFMQSDLFMTRALNISVGSLSPTINWRTMARQEFALPPLAEQRRIAGVLRTTEEELEAMRQLECDAEVLRKSHIVDAFSKITDDPNTTMVSVADAGEVLMGRQRSPKYQQGISPRPYLRVANVFDGYIDTTDVNQMDFSEVEFSKYQLVPGDILLVEGHSSAEVVGRSSIYQGEIPNSCFQNTLLRFRSRKTSVDYSHHYFRYCLYTGKFAKVAKQTTIAHLGKNRFAAMWFPLIQAKMEQRVIEELSSIEKSCKAVLQRREKIEQLKRALLDATLAFA